MYNCIIFLFMLLASCVSISDNKLSAHRVDFKPILGCGVQCLTINQGEEYTKQLNVFLAAQNINKTLVIANCRDHPVSPVFMNKVMKDILVRGVHVAPVRAMLPYRLDAKACMMLVRGPVIMYPPNCNNYKTEKHGWNFTCYSEQNLAYMIDNPKDMMVLSGRSGELR